VHVLSVWLAVYAACTEPLLDVMTFNCWSLCLCAEKPKMKTRWCTYWVQCQQRILERHWRSIFGIKLLFAAVLVILPHSSHSTAVWCIFVMAYCLWSGILTSIYKSICYWNCWMFNIFVTFTWLTSIELLLLVWSWWMLITVMINCGLNGTDAVHCMQRSLSSTENQHRWTTG